MLQPFLEGPADGPEIDALLDLAFGPDRQAKISYRYRQDVAPVPELSRVVRADNDPEGAIIGSIRYWPILVGGRYHSRPALLLGPLAIHPSRQNTGIGRALAFGTLDMARKQGHRAVLLVGALSYYTRFGFARVPRRIVMPDEQPERLLGLALVEGGLAEISGEILRADGQPGRAAAGPTNVARRDWIDATG